MEIQFLGTGAGLPSKSRNVTCNVLKLLDEINELWLFDCGEGSQHQMLHTNLKPSKITRIFITHLHGDHIYGLPGLLSSRSFQGGENHPLTLYGPRGLRNFVEGALRMSYVKLNYPLHFQEINGEFGEIVLPSKFKVYFHRLDHNVSSYGFRIVEPDFPGELLVDKALAMGVPKGPLLGKLKQKQDIKLPTGEILHGIDFVKENIPGRIVTILGDTRPNSGISVLAKDADVLVHEGTYGPGEAKLAHAHFHSTVIDAAKIATQANVKQLYITHLSARYLGDDIKNLIQASRAIFPNTFIAKDFACFDIPKRKI